MIEIVGVDFLKFVNFSQSDDFDIYEMGRYASVPNYSYRRASSEHTIIHFVISGKGFLELNGKRFDIHAGQAFIIPKDTSSYYEADAEEPWEYLWFHLGGPKLPTILKKAGISVDNPIFTPTENWDKIIDLILDTFDNYDKEYYCMGNIFKIFYYMTEFSADKEEIYIDPTLVYVKNVIGYIKLKYSDPIKIEHIALACGLNRSYLTRLFKEATGYTLQQYLTIYRMKQAMRLLKETDKSIQEITAAVGYSDTFTFSKAFKRQYGKSPSSFRDE